MPSKDPDHRVHTLRSKYTRRELALVDALMAVALKSEVYDSMEPLEREQMEIAIGNVIDQTQPGTMGSQTFGLDASPTGTDPSADVVADFTGATTNQFSTDSVVTPITIVHSQTLGSTFKITQPGIWVCIGKVEAITAASVRTGIGVDLSAGEINVDPAYSSRMLDLGLSISAGADTVPISVTTGPIGISQTIAYGAATGIARLLISNNAGAGAAAASLSLTLASMRVFRLGNLPKALANA